MTPSLSSFSDIDRRLVLQWECDVQLGQLRRGRLGGRDINVVCRMQPQPSLDSNHAAVELRERANEILAVLA